MTVAGTVKIEMQLAGTAGAWTDVTTDVQYPVRCSYGITGNTITDRVASTGYLSFDLDNSSSNSSGTMGYYSPGATTVRGGFAPGITTRLSYANGTVSKVFHGHIPSDGIQTEPLQYSNRKTHVTAVDWMDYAAEFPIELEAVQTDKRIDEVVTDIVSMMPIPPLNTDYDTGQETFSYVYDTLTGKTRAIREFQKLANSEFGYIYVKRDADGEQLTVDARYTKSVTTSSGTIDDVMMGMSSAYGANYANRVKVTSYPRQIDAAATTVLASLQKTITLTTGESVTLVQKYRDPTGGSNMVSGTDMVSPASTTDYLMNAAADGGGADLTADLDVTANYGSDGVQWILVNNNAATGYVTHLQCRGKGIYFFDPTASIQEDSTGIDLHGEKETSVDQQYQDNPLASDAAAQYWSIRLATLRDDIQGVTYNPNRTQALMDLFLSADIGDKFTLSETVTGLSSEIYLINGIDFEIAPSGFITCTYIPFLAIGESFWRLSYSQLDISTTLGY